MRKIIIILIPFLLVGFIGPKVTHTVELYPEPYQRVNEVEPLAVEDQSVTGRNDANFSIPDHAPGDPNCTQASSSISISGAPVNAAITGITYSLQIAHTYVGDLEVRIEKEGHFAHLWNRDGGPVDNNLDDDPENDDDIEFYDESADAFQGLSPNGVWRLVAGDCMVYDTGFIDWWEFEIFYVTEPKLGVTPNRLVYTYDYDLEAHTEPQHLQAYDFLYQALETEESIRVIVTTQDNRRESTLAALSSSDFQVKRVLASGFAAYVTSSGLDTLSQDPNVISVVEDIRAQVNLNQSRPLINADDAQTLGWTGEGVTVAVIDTGIDNDHPDLRDDILAQKCFTDGACPPGGRDQSDSAEDDEGHGTAVSGIITSAGYYNIAPIGIAPDAGIVAVKVLDGSGSGWMSDIQAGVEWATAHAEEYKIRVINVDLGGGGHFQSNCDFTLPSMAAAIQAANNMGLAVFVASGNEASLSGVSIPACMTGAISVGAVYDAGVSSRDWGICEDYTTSADKVICYSNTGANLDLLAPSFRNRTTGLNGDNIGNFGGTSAASPHAAAVAALMLQANPSLDPQLIETRMEISGVAVIDQRTGSTFPRIDALAAIQATGLNISNVGAGTLVINHIELGGNSCWLNLEVTTPFSLLAGESKQIAADINPCVPAGTYADTLRIYSNDAQQPIFELPVELLVVGESPPTPELDFKKYFPLISR